MAQTARENVPAQLVTAFVPGVTTVHMNQRARMPARPLMKE